MKGFVVALDGPAGSGKSTTARQCARQLGFHYLDTGAMYRAATLKVIRSGTDPRNRAALGRVLRSTKIDLLWRHGALKVLLCGRDVTREIREPGVNGLVSEVSAIRAVRRMMVVEQRRIARGRNLVCEGRDIGSVVFPEAGLKVFLDCDVSERSRRRDKELRDGGVRTSRRLVTANLVKRDRIDSSRSLAPLRRVPDAVLVDTAMLTIEEQVAVVCFLVRQRLARRKAEG